MDSTLPIPTIKLGTPTTPTTPSPNESLQDSGSTESLENLLDTVVHEMTDEQLREFVKKCSLLRQSAQTRKAALVKEGVEKHGAKRKVKKKDDLSAALQLLMGGKK